MHIVYGMFAHDMCVVWLFLMFYMAKQQSIVWKFFNLIEQQKDERRLKMQHARFV